MTRISILLISLFTLLISCKKEDNQLQNTQFNFDFVWKHMFLSNIDAPTSYSYSNLFSQNGEVVVTSWGINSLEINDAFKVLNKAYQPDSFVSDIDYFYSFSSKYPSTINGHLYYKNKLYVWGNLKYASSSTNNYSSLLFTYDPQSRKVEENLFFVDSGVEYIEKLMIYKGELVAFTRNYSNELELNCISCSTPMNFPDFSHNNLKDFFAVKDKLFRTVNSYQLEMYNETTATWVKYSPNTNNYRTLYVFEYNDMICALGKMGSNGSHLVQLSNTGSISQLASNDDLIFSVPMDKSDIKIKISEDRLFIYGNFTLSLEDYYSGRYLLEYANNELILLHDEVSIADVVSANGDLLIIQGEESGNLYKYMGN